MIPILMYHSIKRVDRNEVMRSLHVSPLSFKIQMYLLKILGYRGCSVSEAVELLNTDRNEKVVALTFDDGYKNFFSNALPILENFGFSATVYVVTGLIGGTNLWDRNSGISTNDLMTLEEIKTCQSKGIEIGCHSATHAKLDEKSVELDEEIGHAKKELELALHTRIHSFCYPYGSYDKHVAKKVKTSGFSSATTMHRGRATAGDSLFELPRIPVTWHTMPHLFLLKIVSQYEDKRRKR